MKTYNIQLNMVKSAEKDYTKALKEYIGEFFIDSE